MQTKIDLKKLRLRPYKKCDAKFIVKWSKDEVAFRKWCSDRWQTYPITAEDMNRKYYDNNGDCIDEDNFYPMTLIDNNTVVGHLILRFTDKERTILRFGFVITDNSKRGLGYGKEMLNLALKYSFEILLSEFLIITLLLIIVINPSDLKKLKMKTRKKTAFAVKYGVLPKWK